MVREKAPLQVPRKSLPEVRAGAEGDGGAVLSYKSKVSLKVNLSRGAPRSGGGCTIVQVENELRACAYGLSIVRMPDD